MSPLTGCCSSRVGVWPSIHQAVAVRGAPAEEPIGSGCEIPHRSPRSDLYSGALPLRHPTEERHDEIVSFGSGVDRPSYLRNPQLYSLVGQDRKGKTELVAVESALRLSDDHALERAPGVSYRS